MSATNETNPPPRRGRPTGSAIRQRIVELLSVVGHGYGYELHKKYTELFPSCTREVVYYHLRKGVKLGEFVVESVKQETGQYSWGTTVEKTYYKLGPNAKPRGETRINQAFGASSQ